MKILYVTTIGATLNFFKNIITYLKSQGSTVDIAANMSGYSVPKEYIHCNAYDICYTRRALSFNNLKAIKQIRNIVYKGEYDIVHCHTPIAAACTRVACRKLRKKGLKVVYTAHGFHFYKGAPAINWIVYYPIEKICSFFTDLIITINQEDYKLATNKFNKAGVEYIPGVGIDTNYFKNDIKDDSFRKHNGIPQEAFLIASVGELNANKNHEVVIKAIDAIKNENVHYAIAGNGEKQEELEQLSESLGMKDRIHFLGFIDNTKELYCNANLYVHPSWREGLPVALMEAISCGTPVIATDIRGNRDLVVRADDELLVDPRDVNKLAKLITKAIDGEINTSEIEIEKFGNSAVLNDTISCYRNIIC